MCNKLHLSRFIWLENASGKTARRVSWTKNKKKQKKRRKIVYAYLRMCIIICRNKKNFFFFIVRRVDSSMRNPWSRKSPPINMRKVYRNWVYISESGPKRSARMETAERKRGYPRVCIGTVYGGLRWATGEDWRMKQKKKNREKSAEFVGQKDQGSLFTHGTIPIYLTRLLFGAVSSVRPKLLMPTDICAWYI